MSHSLKAAAQDILFSGEAYRNFVCSARSEATKNAYTNRPLPLKVVLTLMI